MDPVQKMWMYNNWLADQNDNAELAKNHAYLLASFWNPEAVQEIMGNGGNTHSSTDEEFEESSNIVRAGSLEMLAALKEAEQPIKRRRRKQIIKQD